MKRPPGVPQAPRPASPGGSDRDVSASPGRRGADRPQSSPAAATAARTPGKTAQPASVVPAPAERGSSASANRPTRSEPDAATEPITVVPAVDQTSSGDVSAPSTPAAGKAVPPVNPPSSASPGLLARLAARRARPTASDAPLTARSARARLRAARRARKQYERSEVRRFTSRSRRRRNLWIAAAGTVVALAAFVLVGVYSPLMALRTIEVTGTSRIPAEDIAEALDGQIGTPLPLLDFTDVKRELSEFSLIRSYVTESRPPDTLVVRIVEREPVGTIASAAGFDLVDAAGVVISSGADRAPDYPVIDAASGASGAGFQAAVAVINALPEGIRSQLDTVTAATTDDVTLSLGGGERVVWGNSARSEYKAIVLSALLVSHPVGSVTEYDVSSPDSAVVR